MHIQHTHTHNKNITLNKKNSKTILSKKIFIFQGLRFGFNGKFLFPKIFKIFGVQPITHTHITHHTSHHITHITHKHNHEDHNIIINTSDPPSNPHENVLLELGSGQRKSQASEQRGTGKIVLLTSMGSCCGGKESGSTTVGI